MRVRVFDKSENKYYISEVYGILNCGVNMYLVDKYNDPEKVILVEYLDFSSKPPYKVNIEKIDINPLKNGKWIYKDKNEIQFINNAVGEVKYHYFNGYECIYNQKEALVELIRNGSVSKKSLNIGNVSTKLDGWNYIEDQADIDFLMSEFAGFEDSVIKEFSYLSGDCYIPEDKMMYLSESGSKQVRIVFDSFWEKEIEIVFLAPRLVHLVPPEENYMSDWCGASMFIKECMVYFYSYDLEEIPDAYEDTYISAMGMMWRFVE